jgi:hypothetical protein
MGYFLFATSSRLDLGPTQSLSPGGKWPGRDTNHTPPSSAEVENAWSYTSTPTLRLHGVVLSLAHEQVCLPSLFIRRKCPAGSESVSLITFVCGHVI